MSTLPDLDTRIRALLAEIDEWLWRYDDSIGSYYRQHSNRPLAAEEPDAPIGDDASWRKTIDFLNQAIRSIDELREAYVPLSNLLPTKPGETPGLDARDRQLLAAMSLTKHVLKIIRRTALRERARARRAARRAG